MTAADTPWRRQAACVGTDTHLFFPGPGDSDSVAAAKAVCRACPVLDDCAAYALGRRDLDGIWGGMTATDRNTERSRRYRQRKGTAA